jgi:hypothetical protein
VVQGEGEGARSSPHCSARLSPDPATVFRPCSHASFIFAPSSLSLLLFFALDLGELHQPAPRCIAVRCGDDLCTAAATTPSFSFCFSFCCFIAYVCARPSLDHLSMPPRKKYDPDVWGPPPPPQTRSSQGGDDSNAAGSSTSATAASSAFQRHFANRTEVVRRDGINAHLGVKAAALDDATNTASVAGSRLAEKQTKPKKLKAAALIRIVAPGETKSRASAATHGGQGVGVRDVLPLIAPTRRVLDFGLPVGSSATTNLTSSSSGQPTVVEVSMDSSDGEHDAATSPMSAAARLSRRSSSVIVQHPGHGVKCLMAPSALAAAVAGRGNSDTARCSPTPPPHSPCWGGSEGHPHHQSALTPSPSSHLTRASHATPTHFPETVAVVAASSAEGRTTAVMSLPPRAGRTPPKTTPSSSSAPSLHRTADRIVVEPSRRLPASAEAQSKNLRRRPPPPQQLPLPSSSSSPTSPSGIGGGTKPSYTPYTLDAYKSLMADVAAYKSGGLGPSDTDAQRAARERRERQRAYGRRAERHARQSLAGAGSASTPADTDGALSSPDDTRKGKKPLRSFEEEGRSPSTSTSSTRTSSSSSSSSSSSHSSSSAALMTPSPGDAKRRTDSPAARPLRRKRATTSANKGEPSPCRGASPASQPSLVGVTHESPSPVNDKPQQRSSAITTTDNAGAPLSHSTPTPTNTIKTTTVAAAAGGMSSPAFAVAAASRAKVEQARARRERALAYAQKVAQERQEVQQQQPPAEETTQMVNGKRGDAISRGEDDDDDDAMMDGEEGGGALTGGAADTATAEARRRRQRLMDLEAAHAQKKAAVDHIRRQLYRGGGQGS